MRAQMIALGALMTLLTASAVAADGGPDLFGYQWTTDTPFSWVDASSGTALFLADDQLGGPFPVGFSFDFYGRSYDQFYIGANGRIAFVEQPETYNIPCVPSGTPFVGYVALTWRDLDPTRGGQIHKRLIGEAPNRVLIIAYDQIPVWGSVAETVTAEVMLAEQTGDLYFQYANASADNGAGAVVGLMNPDGTDGLSIACHESWLAPGTAILVRHPAFVQLTIPDDAVAAPAGQTAVFDATVRNVIGRAASFAFSFADSPWAIETDPAAVTLEHGETGAAQFRVSIPAGAADWETSAMTASVYVIDDPTIQASRSISVTAGRDWLTLAAALVEPVNNAAVATDGEWIYSLSDYLGPGISGAFMRFKLDGAAESLPTLEPPLNVTDGVFLWNKLVFPGGIDEEGAVSDVMHLYDPESGEWGEDYAMPLATAFAAVAVLNERLYVIGGFDGEQALAKVWAFYPGSATWRRVASLNQPRRRPLAGAAGGKLIVVGGLDAEVYTAEAYDPDANEWTYITPPPLELNDGADCTCNGKFYVLGGRLGETASSLAYEYDPAFDSWTPISRMQAPRFAVEADLLAGAVVIAGGDTAAFTPSDDAEALDLDCADELVKRPDEFGTRPDLDNPDDDEAPADKDGDDDEGCCGC